MNSVPEALNTLISAVNVAQNKGGVYSLEEAHYIYTAISYLNSLQKSSDTEQEVSVESPSTATPIATTEGMRVSTDDAYTSTGINK
jgi:hypothetical protein